MESCGYIYTGDTKSNLQNTLKLDIYPCVSVNRVNENIPLWRCRISKNTLFVIESDAATPPVSHLVLEEVAKTAVKFDKKLIFPSKLSYKLDANGNPILKFESNIKEIFPVPDKTEIFGEIKNYINITSVFGKEEYFTPLLASNICDLLNLLALYNGYVDNRIFCQSCGRVFADADFFMSSMRGRRLLRTAFTKEYEVLKIIYKGVEIPQRLSPKKHRVRHRSKKSVTGDTIARLRHNAACRLVSKTSFFGFAAHAKTVYELAQALSLASADSAQRLAANGALNKAADGDYLSADDIAAACFDQKCREDLCGLATSSRKFFNAAKDRKIICMDTCGRIY